jgi:hypothetical protein
MRWTWFKYLEGLLKEVTASYTYINKDITHIKKKVFPFVNQNIILSFSFSILDSLHYFDKIYKDVCTMEYHFGSNNWSNTKIIDLGTKKQIPTSKFSFQIYNYQKEESEVL